MLYRIGTRGSVLALAQAEIVRSAMAAAYPGDMFELAVIRTAGDRDHSTPLAGFDRKGIFVCEIEEQLMDGRIDLAVHSMKDLPGDIPEGLCLSKAWKRANPREALILREGLTPETLSKNAVIGTCSRRRALQMLSLYPGVQIVPVRGNIETRIRKIEEQHLDGVILAAAGPERLSMDLRTEFCLEPELFLPAPAQGVLGIELRHDRTGLLGRVNALSDPETDLAVDAERKLLKLMGGGCTTPVGAYCRKLPNGRLRLLAGFGSDTENVFVRVEVTADTPEEAAVLASDGLKHAMKERI